MSSSIQPVTDTRRRPQSASRTLADAVRSALARGQLEAALQATLEALEQPATRRQALRQLILVRRSVCAPEALPPRECRALGAVFGMRLRQALRRAG